MAIFTIIIAIFVGVIIFIPFFFMKTKDSKTLVAVIALIGALVAGTVAAYCYPRYQGWVYERTIVQEPIYKLIAQNRPQEFNQYILQVKEVYKNKRDENEITKEIAILSEQLVNNTFSTYLKNAPDDNIVLFLKATINLYQYLYTIDPNAVVNMERSDVATFEFSKVWGDGKFQVLLRHLLDTKRLLIQASIKNPAKVPAEDEAEPLLREVLDRLANKYGEENVKLMFAPSGSSVSADQMAKVFMEFYAEILNAGKEKAGIMLRYIGDLKAKAIEGAQNQTRNKIEDTQKAKDSKPPILP